MANIPEIVNITYCLSKNGPHDVVKCRTCWANGVGPNRSKSVAFRNIRKYFNHIGSHYFR